MTLAGCGFVQLKPDSEIQEIKKRKFKHSGARDHNFSILESFCLICWSNYLRRLLLQLLLVVPIISGTKSWSKRCRCFVITVVCCLLVGCCWFKICFVVVLLVLVFEKYWLCFMLYGRLRYVQQILHQISKVGDVHGGDTTLSII